MSMVDQLTIGVRQVGVGDNQVGPDFFSRLKPDTRGPAIEDIDLSYRCLGAHGHPHFLCQAHHVFDNPINTPHGKPHPQCQISVRDHAIHGQRIKGRQTQEHRVKREGFG